MRHRWVRIGPPIHNYDLGADGTWMGLKLIEDEA